MTERMIQKNFSNFSAWHYRGKTLEKLQAIQHLKEDHDIEYLVPLSIIDKEFE